MIASPLEWLFQAGDLPALKTAEPVRCRGDRDVLQLRHARAVCERYLVKVRERLERVCGLAAGSDLGASCEWAVEELLDCGGEVENAADAERWSRRIKNAVDLAIQNEEEDEDGDTWAPEEELRKPLRLLAYALSDYSEALHHLAIIERQLLPQGEEVAA